MRRVVFTSDDPRLEERQESPRTLIDAALRIARDSVDNLVDLDRLAAFPSDFGRIVERPSTSSRVAVYKDVADAASRVSALGLLAELAGAYDREKARLGVMDFADQVAGALRIVREHPPVVEELRSRYRVVLLDEYQDTSVVQTDLLSTLFAGTGVMAVGDPHQAIYAWRGASAGNLGGFPAAFAPEGGCRTFSLLTSWRNSARVLTAANAVLAPLANRSPVAVEELLPRPGAPEGVVEAFFERDLDSEADRVAAWFAGVRAARAAGERTTTGAVLFRSKKHMVRFGDALGRRGIPHRILGLGGLLTTPEVVDVVSALRVISDPEAGSALIRLLSGPRWSIGLADLRALAQLARRLATHDVALQPLAPEVVERLRSTPGADRASLVDALDFVARQTDGHGWLTDLTDEGRARLREAGAVFAGLRRNTGAPIPELIRLIETELRLDVELAANESRGPARIASAQLRAFVDEIRGFLAADESGSVTSLLAWLDHAEQADEFAPRTEPPEDDVVQLLTITDPRAWSGMPLPSCASSRTSCPRSPATRRGGWDSASCRRSSRGLGLVAGPGVARCRDPAGAEGGHRGLRRGEPCASARRGSSSRLRRLHPRPRSPAAVGVELVGHETPAHAERVPGRGHHRPRSRPRRGRPRRGSVRRRTSAAALAPRPARCASDRGDRRGRRG